MQASIARSASFHQARDCGTVTIPPGPGDDTRSGFGSFFPILLVIALALGYMKYGRS